MLIDNDWWVYFYVLNLLKIGKYENTVFACTNDALRLLSITECKTIISLSILLSLTKLVFLCSSTIINSSASSSILFLTKPLALFLPIILIILFHYSLSFLKSCWLSLWMAINVILFFNLCILSKKFFIFICNGAIADLISF